MSHYHSTIPLLTILTIGVMPLVVAVDQPGISTTPRMVADIMLGTAGFEPGIALEWRLGDRSWLVRPEAFINDDYRPGFGASAAWDLSVLNLPERHAFTLGPRVVYHNGDRYGWEIGAMGIWHFDLVPTQRDRHFLEVIGTVGAIQDDRDDENNTVFGASAGLGYGFQF